VGYSFDRRTGHEFTNELKFGRARLRVVARDRPDRTAVEVDPVVVGVGLLAVGEVPLIIEHVGQDVDSFGGGLACEFVFRAFYEAASTPLEYSIQQFWIFFFDVFEEFYGEAAVGCDEEWFGEVGGVVAVRRTSWLAAVLSGGDETGGSQCPEVLANGAGGDLEGAGEFLGGCVTAALQCSEYPALSGRRLCTGRGHSLIIA